MTDREIPSINVLLTMRPELNPESELVEPPFFLYINRETREKTLVLYLPDGRCSQKMLNVLCNRYFPGKLEESISCHIVPRQGKIVLEISVLQ